MPRGGFSGGGGGGGGSFGGGRGSFGGGGRGSIGRSGPGAGPPGGRGGGFGGGFPSGGGRSGGGPTGGGPGGGGFPTGGGGFGGGGFRGGFGGGGMRGGGGFFSPFGGGGGFRRGGGGCGTGCVTTFVVVIIILIALNMTFGPGMFSSDQSAPSGAGSGSGYNVTQSTVKRTPLPKGMAKETGYYTDEVGFIKNPQILQAGMRNFYNKTGVQPYLYITDTVNGTTAPNASDMDKYANALYDKLFKDEAHLLLLYWETADSTPGDYKTQVVTGTQANTVIDEQAATILLDYIDRYYADSSLGSYDEMFSKSFNDAGDRIMAVTVSPGIWITGALIVLAVLALLFYWWTRVKKQKNIEAEQTEKILNTPLEKLGPGPTGLEDKYKDPPPAQE